MRIDHVRLDVPDPAAAAAFHRDVLGLPVRLGAGVARVRIGWTELVLEPDRDGGRGRHHLAVTVPPDAGAAAHRWLAGRADLLTHDGATRFETAPGWDAESVYVGDPDGMVLELVARRRRPGPLGSATFGPGALLGVSEVGVPVDDVRATAARLRATCGLEPFGADPSSTFGAVGDDEGLLVLVAPGRPWFPTADVVSGPAPCSVRVSGTPRAGTLALHRSAVLTARDLDQRG